jgi:hypothetical protein
MTQNVTRGARRPFPGIDIAAPLFFPHPLAQENAAPHTLDMKNAADMTVSTQAEIDDSEAALAEYAEWLAPRVEEQKAYARALYLKEKAAGLYDK